MSKADVTVQGLRVASVSEVLAQPDNTLPALAQELQYQASRAPELAESKQLSGRPIIVMGDEHMPYKLLKRNTA